MYASQYGIKAALTNAPGVTQVLVEAEGALRSLRSKVGGDGSKTKAWHFRFCGLDVGR